MEWTRGPVIGRGSSATVSLATDAVSGDLFAVKHAELSRSLPLQKEQSLLCKLDPSPHIVKYLGSNITNEGKTLVFNLCIEYVSGGTLHEYIRSMVRGFLDDEVEIRSCTRGILRGLEHLHGNGIAHCDVKSQNVLIGRGGGVKIADLGSAKFVGRSSNFSDNSDSPLFSGTLMFIPPEVVRGEEQGTEADVWALGCTVIEMAAGTAPWPGESDPVSVLYRIGFSEDVPEIPTWLSESGRDFLDKCLRRDPRERWTVRELLRHPFIGEFSLESGSPNGVLDRVFWESTEESSSSSHIDDQISYDDGFCSSSSDCAKERIKKLMVREFEFESINWTNHGDWIDVRSNDDDEDYDNVDVIMPERLPPVISVTEMVIDSISGEEPRSSFLVNLISEETYLNCVSSMEEDGSVCTIPLYNNFFMNIIFLEVNCVK